MRRFNLFNALLIVFHYKSKLRNEISSNENIEKYNFVLKISRIYLLGTK